MIVISLGLVRALFDTIYPRRSGAEANPRRSIVIHIDFIDIAIAIAEIHACRAAVVARSMVEIIAAMPPAPLLGGVVARMHMMTTEKSPLSVSCMDTPALYNRRYRPTMPLVGVAVPNASVPARPVVVAHKSIPWPH